MLIPRPRQVVRQSGQFILDTETTLHLAPGADRAATLLRLRTGLPLRAAADSSFVLAIDPALSGLGDEGYGLTVGRDAVLLRARTDAGLVNGVHTISALIERGGRLPCVQISDSPRFPWRGAMLDVARHFQPVSYLRSVVDRIASYKLNVLHLHLTDDQGWRMPVDAYPLLTETGSVRAQTMGDGTPHGGHYTKAELRELVAYAAARGVRIVPEIEMPGHARAALAAYPHLGNYPQRRLEVWDHWGICENVFGVHDEAFAFCTTVLDEVMEVFDSPYVHIGGDECPTVEWEESPVAREVAARAGLSPKELNAWFLSRVGRHLLARGRTPVCWAEPDATALPPEFVVMPWRDAVHGLGAARRGHDVVMTPHRTTYLDYPQSDAPDEPPGQPGDPVTLADVYTAEPAPADWEPAEAARVLGTQAQLWTEHVATPAAIDYLLFPRIAALAEVAWSEGPRDLTDFRRRL
ncbi:beta-N-acetylhexosaminidase [Streptomyces sp. TRM66268-LWL]|uniref:beta-N-acetylhexosaminidase n=1 Tax=Streptomyces polyasparticus TaxID=2767826 RepID=A0ABR7SDN7_9ACTN|nr:beta-N-acetylhexosaminidase [Streptomyces polyasparticus]MBC9713616.1 beta-N-acetylhexosaminidase [Streptomyces polyasparticus]